MQNDDRDCPCSERPAGVEGPARGPMKISPEAYERLSQAPLPSEFRRIMREGIPAMDISDLSDLPRTGPGIDMTPFETPMPDLPVQPVEMPALALLAETDPSSIFSATMSYFTEWRLDLSGVAHMTPGLHELADLPLGQLMCETQGGEGDWVFLFQEDGDGGGGGGGTVVDDPDPPFIAENGRCIVGVYIRLAMKRKGAPEDENPVETYNLNAGFEEIVIPVGFEALPEVKPDASRTGPYDGTLTVTWEIIDDAEKGVLFTGTVSGGSGDLGLGKDLDKVPKIKNTASDASLSYPVRDLPVSRKHKITYTWDPEDVNVNPCPDKKEFTVTFAQEIRQPPNLDLGGDYTGLGGFGGFRGRQPGVFDPGPISSRDGNILVSIVTYWEVGDCCGLTTKAEVVQFARAVITGPNGYQGKDWTLDILGKPRNGKPPNHDPTFTNKPYDDKDESPTMPNAGGGTRGEGPGKLGQWDAPGMPKRLYDQLAAAQTGPSVYRQQFLSLLVCRRRGVHSANGYLKTGKIRSMLVFTVQWNFPGMGAAPRVTVSSQKSLDFGPECFSLARFLKTNGFLNGFNEPTEDARKLEILPKEKYDKVKDDLDAWERDPLGQLKLP